MPARGPEGRAHGPRPRLGGRAPPRRHRQGRHRQDHGRRRARPRAGRAGAACCSSRSRAGRASPSSSTCRRWPTRSAGSPSAPAGGEVFALAVDAERRCWSTSSVLPACAGPAGSLDRLGASTSRPRSRRGCATSCSPARSYEAVGRRTDGRTRTYDAVVLDAPPTGRITRFLNVNAEVAGWRRSGRSSKQAELDHARCCARPQTVVHLVTLLEEMPVQETVDGVAELPAAGLPVGGVVVNAVRTRDARGSRACAQRCGRPVARRGRRGTARRGPAPDTRLVDALLAEAAEHAERVALERRERRAGRRAGPADVRAAAARRGRRPRRACYELAERLRRAGRGVTRPGTGAAPRRRRRRRPGDAHRRLLRLRRRRQDDDGRGAGAAGGRAGPRASSC